MATRSFSVTMIRWVDNTAGNTYGPVRVLPDGKDLLDLLEGVLESLDASPARDKSRETLTKQVGRAKSRRTILGQMRHGGYGEDGEVVDTRTGQITYTYRPDQATTLVHRLLITVPPSGDAAMLFIEHASRRNPGKAFLDRLDDHWKARFPSHDLVTETMQESDAWLEQATLVSATAIYSDSLAANQVPHGIPARISKTITPQASYAQRLWNRLLNGTLQDRAQYFGIPAQNADEIKVILEVGGREKVMLLDNPRTPTVRIQLCGPRDAFPTDADFLHACFAEAPRLYKAVGGSWKAGWQ